MTAWRHHKQRFLARLVVRGFTVAEFEASIQRRRPTIARVRHIQNAADPRVGSSVACDAGERTHGAIAILFGISGLPPQRTQLRQRNWPAATRAVSNCQYS